MEVIIDTKTVSEAGFNEYLVRTLYESTDSNLSITRYTDPNSLVGGIIGGEGIIYLGSKQFKLDGKNRRITIGDASGTKILIGYE